MKKKIVCPYKTKRFFAINVDTFQGIKAVPDVADENAFGQAIVTLQQTINFPPLSRKSQDAFKTTPVVIADEFCNQSYTVLISHSLTNDAI